MGTISDKLMRIINTKEDIRQALISKGYDVPTSIPFKEYAKMILDLPCNADSFPDIEGIVARYSASGLTNEQMAANPVWVDKTGNGHDLQMKNFAWGGMSGVGGYVQDFNYFRNNSTVDKVRIDEQGSNSIKVTLLTPGVSYAIFILKDFYQFNKSYFIKISSEGYNEGDLFLSFYVTVTSTATPVKVPLNPNGITEIPAIKEDDYLAVYLFNAAGKVGSITIEQLPLYPGALVFDGVDDYGVCENFPILTKEKGYTVVALGQWISMGEGLYGLVSNVKNWFNDGAFVLEYNSNNATNKFVNKPVSFGKVNIEMDLPNNFTYQTSKSYKGVPITTGSFKGTNSLFVGKLNNIIGNYSNVAIWELVFLDHDATEEELTKIKDYFVKTYPWLFPDQAWTVTGKTNEDEDRATIANITGNGNDLVLSNFGFAGNSGYGDYPISFPSSLSEGQPYGTLRFKTDGKYSNLIKTGVTDIRIKFNLRGMPEGGVLSIRGLDPTTALPITEKSYTVDGLYEFVYNDSAKPVNIVFYNGTPLTGLFDFYVDIIPEYEGYLVTDGVDDRVQDSSFKLNKDWTLVGEWVFLNQKATNAGITKPFSFVVYNRTTGLSLFINTGTSGITIENVKSIKAICSDGRIYLDDWSEMLISKDQDITSSTSVLSIGFNGTAYTQMAFKNLGIYNNQILSKDECIKAYNYLQTLKSK